MGLTAMHHQVTSDGWVLFNVVPRPNIYYDSGLVWSCIIVKNSVRVSPFKILSNTSWYIRFRIIFSFICTGLVPLKCTVVQQVEVWRWPTKYEAQSSRSWLHSIRQTYIHRHKLGLCGHLMHISEFIDLSFVTYRPRFFFVAQLHIISELDRPKAKLILRVLHQGKMCRPRCTRAECQSTHRKMSKNIHKGKWS